MPHTHSCKERIREILRKFFDGDEKLVDLWLNSPSSAFGGYCPQSLINEGRPEVVCSALEAMHSGNVCS
jgi:hypothetical protein